MKPIHRFGLLCTFFIEGRKQKLDARGQHGTFLGINPLNQSYYILNSRNNNILTTRNIHIHQDSDNTDITFTDFEHTDEVQVTPMQT